MTDEPRTFSTLAELADWERRHDRGVPPKLVPPATPQQIFTPVTPRERLIAKIALYEKTARELRDDAALRIPGWTTDGLITAAEGWEERARVHRESLVQLDDDMARAAQARGFEWAAQIIASKPK